MAIFKRPCYLIFALLPLLALALAACGGDDDGGEAFEPPAPGQYSFDVEATIEFTITEEAVSAAATAGQQTFSGSGTGSAGIDFGTGGSGTFGDMKIEFTIERGEGGAVKLTFSESPERDSTLQIGSDGTSANLFFDVDLPADILPGSDGSVTTKLLAFFGFTLTDDPPFPPLDLQLAEDPGRVSLTTRDTEVDVGFITEMTLMLIPQAPAVDEGSDGEPPSTPRPTAAPTEPPPAGGLLSAEFSCDLTLLDDFAGNAPAIGFSPVVELEFSQLETLGGEAFAATGPPPWIEVVVIGFPDGAFRGTGVGEVAGFPDIRVEFNIDPIPGVTTNSPFFLDDNFEFGGIYTMGVDFGLPGGVPISYQGDCVRVPF